MLDLSLKGPGAPAYPLGGGRRKGPEGRVLRLWGGVGGWVVPKQCEWAVDRRERAPGATRRDLGTGISNPQFQTRPCHITPRITLAPPASPAAPTRHAGGPNKGAPGLIAPVPKCVCPLGRLGLAVGMDRALDKGGSRGPTKCQAPPQAAAGATSASRTSHLQLRPRCAA